MPPAHSAFTIHRRLDGFGAFSLVELMVVMGVISVVAAMIIPAVGNLGRSSGLSVASRQLADLARVTRTEAISKRSVMRLFFPMTGSTADYQRVVVLKRESGGSGMNFEQASGWTKLPEGIVFDTTNSQFQSNLPGNFIFSALDNRMTVTLSGRQMTGAFIEFVPTGAVRLGRSEPSSVRLAVVEGEVVDDQMTYRGTGDDGLSDNWAVVSLQGLTGMAQVIRP